MTPPDYTGPNPDRRHSLSRHPSSGTSTPTNSFRGLPTIIDSESEEATRSRTPLPALPNTGRRRTSSTSSAPKTPFQAALARMEAASLKIMVKRLIEDWSGDEDPSEMEDVLFEQNLWSLMARQWLTQGKQLQCPVHEMLLSAHPSDGKRILNLYGTIADGWVLAAKYPSCTVLTLTTAPIPQTSHLWPSPPNHHLAPHHHAIQNPLPFPPNHFDVITSRHFSSTVPAASWISLMRACHVALKPYGWLEIQSLDAPPSRCGPLLTTWLESRLFPSLDSQSLVSKPSELVLDYLEIAGFADIKACKIALPAVMHGDSDSVRVMVQAGRHYYQELFSNAVVRPSGKLTWWWFNKSVRAECEREGSLLGFMISFGQKAG